MKTTTVELSLRDLTCVLRSLRETGDALAKRIGDEEDDVHGDLMLVDDPPPERAHFCLVVEGGLDDLRARLEAAGIETRDATPLQNRPRFFCHDPFGNLVELSRIDG